MFARNVMYPTDFSRDRPYSEKCMSDGVLYLALFTVISPPSVKNMTYFASSVPYHPLAMCFIARIVGVTSNMLNASFVKMSPEADV